MFVETELRPEGEVTRPLAEWQKHLLRAAEIIEERGWLQGDYEDGRGRVCAIGALNAARGSTDETGEAFARLRQHVGRIISHWNDAPSRTEEEVLAMLRAVALGG